jgi:GAF domain-containing protein
MELSYENARLAALSRLHIMDTEPEEAFDRVARLAGRLLHAPMAAISLIDRDRQWFKARVGFTLESTPRAYAFCDHVLRSKRALVVPDALNDPRFSDNPLVCGELGLRFYAGAPIIVHERYALGALCVIDRKPREPSREDVMTIEYLARVVADEIEMREPQDRDDTPSALDLSLTERERLLLRLLTSRAGAAVSETDLAALGYGVFAPNASAARVREEMETLRRKLATISGDGAILTRDGVGYRVKTREVFGAAKKFPGVFGRDFA